MWYDVMDDTVNYDTDADVALQTEEESWWDNVVQFKFIQTGRSQ